MNRRLVVIPTVLSLVVSLVLLLPQTAANAADPNVKYGTPSNFHASAGMWNLGPINLAPECNGTAYYVATRASATITYSLKYSTKCSAQTTGFNDIFSDLANRTVKLTGINQDTNSPCTVTGTGYAENSTWGFTDKGTVSIGSAPDASASTGGTSIPDLFDFSSVCRPTRIESKANGSGGAGNWSASLSLGALPTFGTPDNHTGKCDYGTPASVSYRTIDRMIGTQRQIQVWADITWSPTAPATGSGFWKMSAAYDATPTSVKPKGAHGVTDLTAGVSQSVNLTGNNVWANEGTVSQIYVGVQIWRTAGNASAISTGGSNFNFLASLNYGQNAGIDTTANHGFGETRPAKCQFWFGPKVYDNASTTDTSDDPYGVAPGIGQDEPGADVADPNAPADPGAPATGCNFSITDPSGWASAGMCAAVGLLGKIVNLLVSIAQLIGNLATSIARAVGGILSDAFIPNPKSWNTGGVRDQFNARPPGSLITASASGVSAASAAYSDGGCGNIFTVDIPRVGSRSVTCGLASSTPGYGALYSLVQVGLMALTGLALFRMFTGAFTRGES